MTSFSVNFDIDPMIERLDALKAVQVPFAASLALNRVAKNARDELRGKMESTYDNPVPFTLNSVFVKSSTKADLRAQVGLKEFAAKGNPASKYLLPTITGGSAYATRFQKSLRYKGILQPGEYAIPTQSDYLRRNKYGNVTPAQYTEILYGLQAFRDSSAFAYQRHSKKKRQVGYEAITTRLYNENRGSTLGDNRGLYPGIYLREKRAIQSQESALFWITKTPQGKGNFPLIDIASARVRKDWDKEFGRALAEAIASAK